MQENNPTIKEHYIPQFYLKQFSPDGKRIYQYDVDADSKQKFHNGIKSKKKYSNLVPIRSICYENNLYELKDDLGNIKYSNIIEKGLSIYEGEFAEIFRSIISKAQNERNFYTNSFLTRKEKEWLILFLSTTVLRKPKYIKFAQETSVKLNENKLTEMTARNAGLLSSLPMYKNINAKDETTLNAFMLLFSNMTFQICYAKKEVLLTSDNPVALFPSREYRMYDEVIIPISPQIAIYMTPFDNNCRCRNKLIELTPLNIYYINSAIAITCERWIYSKQPFTDKQIRMITKERKLSGLC